mmetsp:Transcript_19888/g.48334  ORF Transcript_19888/g.48334 Transcript_19888/m.48334 type:complete len:450 (+) Transcript_19888:1550-2899(+)
MTRFPNSCSKKLRSVTDGPSTAALFACCRASARCFFSASFLAFSASFDAFFSAFLAAFSGSSGVAAGSISAATFFFCGGGSCLPAAGSMPACAFNVSSIFTAASISALGAFAFLSSLTFVAWAATASAETLPDGAAAPAVVEPELAEAGAFVLGSTPALAFNSSKTFTAASISGLGAFAAFNSRTLFACAATASASLPAAAGGAGAALAPAPLFGSTPALALSSSNTFTAASISDLGAFAAFSSRTRFACAVTSSPPADLTAAAGVEACTRGELARGGPTIATKWGLCKQVNIHRIAALYVVLPLAPNWAAASRKDRATLMSAKVTRSPTKNVRPVMCLSMHAIKSGKAVSGAEPSPQSTSITVQSSQESTSADSKKERPNNPVCVVRPMWRRAALTNRTTLRPRSSSTEPRAAFSNSTATPANLAATSTLWHSAPSGATSRSAMTKQN